ncbi:MAG: ParA family protein, partial [Clostridia bacterium]|nr:ParA family protein [Clostridia bacterium]
MDADLEAPGISWLLHKRLTTPPVAFTDLISLAHGDPDPEAEETIGLVADRLRGALIDGLYVLPAFRTLDRFHVLEVRPEHLMEGAEDPYVLTHLLARLGKTLGVRAVVVDLRAGLSELAAGLLLDPRVYRVLVTTLSGQSVFGTCQELGLMARLAPSTRDEEPLPAIVIAQVEESLAEEEGGRDHRTLLERQEERILEAARPFLGEQGDRWPLRVVTQFDARLMHLPLEWADVFHRIEKTGLVSGVAGLADWLPIGRSRSRAGTAVEELAPLRRRLRDFAKRLVYAESGEGEDFLATAPLRHLASDHRHQVPIAVVVGSKGSGKTYTFLQVVRSRNWRAFIQAAGVRSDEKDVDAWTWPLLEPKNLADPAKDLVRQVRQAAIEALGFEGPSVVVDVRDSIRDALRKGFHEGEWR